MWLGTVCMFCMDCCKDSALTSTFAQIDLAARVAGIFDQFTWCATLSL